MAVSLKHSKVSSVPDGADSSLVRPSDWNAEHTLTLAEGKVLGRTAGSGTGAAEELPISVSSTGNVAFSGTGATTLQSGTTAERPGTPVTGMIRFNTSTPGFEGYNGTAWNPVGGSSVTTSDTPPGSPLDGDLWWDSADGQMYVYYDDGTSSQWVVANSFAGSTAYLPLTGGTVTGAVAFPAGSASTPSVIPAGDTNTGIFFPAADTIAFTEGGVEAMRIDASGNVGIGTSSPVSRLDLGSIVHGTPSTGVTASFWNSTGNVFGLGVSAGQFNYIAGTTSANSHVWYSNGSERMRIDSSGNVGIGTTTPIRRLTLAQAGTPEFLIQDTSQGTDLKNWRIFNASQTLQFGTLNDAGTAGTNALVLDRNFNLQFNSGYGSVATAYGCRAWVNFNGTGVVAIRASGNVSSITDNGTGDYTANFTTAMPDANYSFVGTSSDPNDDSVGPVAVGAKSSTYVPTTTGRRFETTFNGTNFDSTFCCIAVFR